MTAKSDVIAPITPFVIAREFDAPRALVWKVWNEPEHVAKWSGPKGTTITVRKLDFRPGGTQHYCMHTPGGDMWGKLYYREIKEPEKLVYVTTFSNEQGELTRHPLSETWPLEMLTTITFVETAGKTTITIEWIPINASETETKTFDENRAGMTGGWSGTFDKLAEYLATQ